MQKICCSLSAGFMRRWLPFAHNRQSGDKTIGVPTVVLYECIQSVDCCVLLNGEKCILPMPPDLIMHNFTLQK